MSTLRGDALLLTRGRPGTASLVAAALLLDALRSGDVEIFEGRRVVAGRVRGDGLPGELRDRVLDASPGTPAAWIAHMATWAPHRIAAELVASGQAAPLSPRFQREFTLSAEPRAEAAARGRLRTDPALAGLLYLCGLPTGDPLPPSMHLLDDAERAVLGALRQSVVASAA